MTIETIKFSEMTDGGNLANNDKTPGLAGGANVLFNNPWTFLPPGNTAARPLPSATVNYRLRFNTDDQLYEYYDAVLGAWTQLQESAFTQGPFITYTADPSLPDAQNLALLADGILRQTISAGVATIDILQIPLTGTYGGTGVNNGTSTITIGGNFQMIGAFTFAGTLTGNTEVTFPTSGTLATTSGASGHVTTGNINELAWYAATGDTVSGLTTGNNGVLITSGAGVPSISSTLPTAVQSNITQLGAQAQALNMNSHLINNVTNPVSAQDAMTLNYAGLTYLALAGGTMAGNISMGSGFRVTNALDPQNPQDYATKFYVDQTALTGTSVYAATINTTMNATQAGAGIGATLTDASGTFAVLTLDGSAVPLNTDVLVKNTGTGVTAANEGIYKLTTNGNGVNVPWQLTRSVDYDTPEQINNTGLIIVQNGSTLAGTAWYNTATIVTVDTTNFNYAQFGTSGSVTSITTSNGVTGGTITTTGNIALDSMFSINASAPSNSFVMNANGETTLPNNPSFQAALGSTAADVTGDGTVYTIIFADQDYDIGAGYNPATGIFTAPVAGDYIFTWTVGLSQIGVAHITGDGLYLSTSNQGNISFTTLNFFVISQSGVVYLSGSSIVRMTAGGTTKVNVMISGGTKTIDVIDVGATIFTGRLIG